MQHYDAIVLGAGAAGLFCALTAGQRGRRVLLLESGPRPGAKILISGGGRCNFTNRRVTAANFFSANPHFAKSALARYTAQDFLALIEAAGITWHEKTLGQLFCDGSARQIVDLLLAGCATAGVTLHTSQQIAEVARTDTGFRVRTDIGDAHAPALVIATGGPSIPKLGASDYAWRLAEQFGLPTLPPRPALVPLTLAPDALDQAFGPRIGPARLGPDATGPGPDSSGPDGPGRAGIAFETEARCAKTRFREAALITHRGLSGPAILQISTAWQPGAPILLDLLPGQDVRALLRDGKRQRPRIALATLLGSFLPQRLAATLAARVPEATGRTLADIPDRHLDALAAHLAACAITPAGTEGFAKAEVTAGGIDTAALSSKTMESRDVPGLYVIGEAVDVTGWLGGYNFQWAWSSGWCAGQAV